MWVTSLEKVKKSKCKKIFWGKIVKNLRSVQSARQNLCYQKKECGECSQAPALLSTPLTQDY